MASAMIVAATIAELNQLLAGTSITALTLSTPAETITLHRQPGAAIAPAPDPVLLALTAPCSGVFLHRHPLRKASLVRIGQAVPAGAVVGLLQVGPLLLHIAAPRAGVVAAITAADAIVGYGTALVHLAAGEEE